MNYKIHSFFSEVEQVSIPGPDRCNAFYDSLLRFGTPGKSCVVDYVDDVPALVTRTVEQARSTLGILMRRISESMTVHSFSLAVEEGEVVIFTKN